MAGHLFVYTPNKDIIMWDYLCSHEECLCLKFLSCVKNTLKFIEIKNIDTDDSEDCLLDEENVLTKILEFVTILSFVAVISCNTSEPICYIKIVEKNQANERLIWTWNFPRRMLFKGILFSEEEVKKHQH